MQRQNEMKVLVATLFAFKSVFAFALDSETRADAIAAAEQFIREEKYDTARRCPEDLQRLDSKKLYHMQPHCRHYAASERNAYAVLETEIFWRIFFRKISPCSSAEGESFRVVEVFRTAAASSARVRLKDIDLLLPNEALRLSADKSMKPTCTDARH
jgi:hypothetical protein